MNYGNLFLSHNCSFLIVKTSILLCQSSPGVDFVILSLADVVILTYGSFGDFGALFGTNRLPVYYPIKHPSHDETGVNKGLPGFKGLPWTILNKKF